MAVFKEIHLVAEIGNLKESVEEQFRIAEFEVLCPICKEWADLYLDHHDEYECKLGCGCSIDDYHHVDDSIEIDDHNVVVTNLEEQVEDLKEQIRNLVREIERLEEE